MTHQDETLKAIKMYETPLDELVARGELKWAIKKAQFIAANWEYESARARKSWYNITNDAHGVNLSEAPNVKKLENLGFNSDSQGWLTYFVTDLCNKYGSEKILNILNEINAEFKA